MEDVPLDDLGGDDTLFGVEVGRGLIDEVHVSRLAEHEADSQSLQLSSGQMDYLLVDDVFDEKGTQHVALELRVDVGVADLLLKKVLHGALEFRGNLLWLVGDVELLHLLAAIICWDHTGQHTDECSLWLCCVRLLL